MDWRPKKSVGPFVFGEPITNYLEQYRLERVDDATDTTGWVSFDYLGGDVQIQAEDGLIVSVACYHTFAVGESQLIGLSLADVQRLLGLEPSEFGEPLIMADGQQIPVEFDALALQVWVKKHPPQEVVAVIATGE